MTKRNYRREYDLYYGRKGKPKTWTKLQKLHRRQNKSRQKIRKKLGEKRRIRKHYDISHVNGNPLDNRAKNLKIIPRSKNRSKNKKKKIRK